MDYYTGFMIEKSLAMDNVFVIALIFSFFAIPRQYQHRVLFWGILGVIVLRAIMIGLGATLVSQFSWVLYLFGAFLIFTGIKMWVIDRPHARHRQQPAAEVPEAAHARHRRLRGNAFWVRETDPKTGKLERFATPLFLALVLVEFVDLIFAVDSVPAIFAITTDPFIVYTSNIFAILGLRALYFALAAMIHRFKYLKYALALVLVFIGSKIFLVGIIGKIPAVISLSVTFGCAGVAVEDARAARRRRVHMTPPIVQRLRDAAAAIQDERVSMRAMAQAHGPEAHGTLLLLLAMPCLLPVPGVGTVLGLGMAALAVAMWRGHCTPCLPQRVAELELPRHWAQRVLVGLASAYALAGRHARARLSHLATSGRRVGDGARRGLMAAIVVMPIPFGNLLPAVALVFIGLGLVFRDGAGSDPGAADVGGGRWLPRPACC
jgi:TerC family integral membrane protein